MKNLFILLRNTIDIWSSAKASRMSAALAYYTMLSLAPLLVIAVFVAGQFFGTQLARSDLIMQIEAITSPQIAETVQMVLRNSLELRSGIFSSLVSLAVLLFGASGVFSQLYDTMNVIWGVDTEFRSGWRYTLKQRALGFIMVIFVGLLLLASLIFTTAVSIMGNYFNDSFPELTTILSWAEASSSILILPLVFILVFRFVPAADISWEDVWIGGILTAVLFFLSRTGIGFYLQSSTVASAYGAAGSLVILLIWVYYTGMIMFLGASFCKAYAHQYGSQSGSPQN